MANSNSLSRTFTFTAPVAIAYNRQLFVPEKFIPDGVTDPETIAKIEPRYSGDFLIQFAPAAHADFERLKADVAALAAEKWPGANLAALDPMGKPAINWPWKNGDNVANEAKTKKEAGHKNRKGRVVQESEFTRGHMVLHALAYQQPDFGAQLSAFTKVGAVVGPGVTDLKNGLVKLEGQALTALKDKLFFPGAEVYVSVTFVARDGNNANKPSVTAYLNSILATGGGTKRAGGRPDFAETFKGYVGQHTAENPLTGTVADPNKVPF